MFSKINDLLIEWAIAAMINDSVGEEWQSLFAYQNLIKTKEDLGIQHAVGEVYFVKGQLTRKEHLWFLQVKIEKL